MIKVETSDTEKTYVLKRIPVGTESFDRAYEILDNYKDDNNIIDLVEFLQRFNIRWGNHELH